METILVEAVAGNPREYQGKLSWGVKLPNQVWITLHQQEKPNRGDRINVEIKQKQGNNGRVFIDAYPVQPPAAQPAPQAAQASSNGNEAPRTNGKLAWDDFTRMIRAAHALARELEPDGPPPGAPQDRIVADRSRARITFVDTIIMSFDHGKIALPKQEEEAEPWDADPFDPAARLVP